MVNIYNEKLAYCRYELAELDKEIKSLQTKRNMVKRKIKELKKKGAQ